MRALYSNFSYSKERLHETLFYTLGKESKHNAVNTLIILTRAQSQAIYQHTCVIAQ